jgi:hypothetical protein
MKLTSTTLLLIAIAISIEAQVPNQPRPFVSRACGFQVPLPADWIVRPSPSKKCVFTIIAPNRADGDIDLSIRNGALSDNQLGFSRENNAWILRGEGMSKAIHIQAATWIGLQGTVGSRIYEKGFYRGFGDQTRALLFDRKHRIAEVACFSGDKLVPELVKGFEFLDQSQH